MTDETDSNCVIVTVNLSSPDYGEVSVTIREPINAPPTATYIGKNFARSEACSHARTAAADTAIRNIQALKNMKED
jgi:hypothetical protein|nr:MAG TPA: hypothetical protein [Caudoviricetes sp.]